MKIAVLGDTHFGMRNDSPAFHAYYKRFYQEVFFPYLREEGITTVIQTGDLFDRRKFINYNSLYQAKQYFFNEFRHEGLSGIDLISYVGNHDIYFKNTLEVNSLSLLVKQYAYIIESPKEIDLNGLKVDIIPWICEDNEQHVKAFIEQSKNKVCFGHFEINGFEMDRGVVCNTGIDRSYLNKYDMVISGHFHHRSSDGHIYYVGSPGEITWADYGDRRGFHVFDTEELTLDFIENPFRMFHKVTYDDRIETLESVANADFSRLANTMVKVVVVNKDNPVMFDHYMDAMYKVQPLDVGIVENFTDYNELSEDDVIDQADSTTDILDKYVDSIDVGLDKHKMKSILRDIYNQALDNESI